MKKVAVLGSTGSIGRQALDIIQNFPESFQATVLAAGGNNLELLERQIRIFRPDLAVVFDQEAAEKLKDKTDDLTVEILSGLDGLKKAAAYDNTDIVLTSLVGAIGILPTIAALEKGKTVALANKETLVAAGEAVISLAQKNKATILPVDSEHSAIFQALQAGRKSELKKILLTASGGPFFSWSREEMERVTPSQALKHPNWSMGGKITIDSATMMNKGLEVIEAKWLFDVAPQQIQVVVQPESIIHSMVEFKDTSVIAQMGLPDMRVPIQYAFTYPERWSNQFSTLDLFALRSLNFLPPDLERFPCLKYAYAALEVGGTMPAVLNAANEIAVYAFLREEINFLQIGEVIEKVMNRQQIVYNSDIASILEADNLAREKANWIIKKEIRMVK